MGVILGGPGLVLKFGKVRSGLLKRGAMSVLWPVLSLMILGREILSVRVGHMFGLSVRPVCRKVRESEWKDRLPCPACVAVTGLDSFRTPC